jgi:hypothetical protein
MRFVIKTGFNLNLFTMKKLYTLTCLLGMSVWLFGQTYLFQDFSSGQMPPGGWTIDGLPAQWSINNGSTAGGSAPEAMFTYINQTNTTRLVSPVIDLTGLTSVSFQFRHMYDDYSGTGPLAGVATRSGGGAWTSVWEINPNGNVGPILVQIDIANANVGQSDFQLCFYLNGNLYNIDYWYLDDIWLYLPLGTDGSLSKISTPTYVSGLAEVKGIVTNFGSNPINSLEINWQADEGDIFSSTFSGLNVNFMGTYNFICDDLFQMPIGSYNLKAWIVNVNGAPDEDPSNDYKEKAVSFVSNTTQHVPCIEEFTSSTCAPCASFHVSFVPWCNNNADNMVLVKYQMNWPGAGDPYYTAEGGVRRNWYGVTWVPWLVMDGSFVNTNVSEIQQRFNISLAESGLADIASSFSLEGTEMTINTTVLPYADFPNAVIHMVVFEYITTGNVATNGETQFEHVMMKMVPNASGTSVSLSDRVPYTLNQTVDLAGTHVEEWDDLGVAIIVQDLGSKYVFNAEYGIENGSFANEAGLSTILVNGEVIPDFSPDVFDYTVSLPSGTTEMPVVEAVTIDPNAIKIVIPAYELPGIAMVDVFAEDLATHSTYTINFDIGTEIDNQPFKAISVYPNPTTGKIYLNGAKNTHVTVYSITGSLIVEYKDFSTNLIDLSGVENGIYILNIVTEDNTVLNKKISILK